MAINRVAIWRRDGGVCGICGTAVSFEVMHLDHIIPESLGGPTVEDNLRPAHPRCNIARGNGRVPRLVPSTRKGKATIISFPKELLQVVMDTARRERRTFTAQLMLIIEQWMEDHQPPKKTR